MNRLTEKTFATRSEVFARNGIAATSHPLANQVALDILKQGGSAVDGAIAANALLGLVEPTGCGIGGDLFAIVWDVKTGKLHGLNGSGRSPRSLSLNHFHALGLRKVPSEGPLSVSVPGTVDAWFALHKQFGQLPMKALLEPAISYAHSGFPVTEVIANTWTENVARLGHYSCFANTYLVNGRAPKRGEIFRNPALSSTLNTIAEQGRDTFYQGELANTMDAFMKHVGGFLSLEDLASHRSEWVEPLSTNYRGYDIWELPPNGQGIAALQILNILEGFDIKNAGFGSALHLHLFLEAKKLAFEDRARFYADPDFNKIPLERLLSKVYASEERARINMEKAGLKYEPSDVPRSGDTVYLTVADGSGNMVSLIQSNFRGMGSGLVPDGLGFCFQSRGELFALEKGHFNTYAPGKRPFHTIMPAFITRNGKPFISFGVMGGDIQPQMHAAIVMNLLDFGMNLQEAGDAPRCIHSGSSQPTGAIMTDGGKVHVESGVPHETLEELKQKGHCVSTDVVSFGGYQAIGLDWETKVYAAASESRKDGHATGY